MGAIFLAFGSSKDNSGPGKKGEGDQVRGWAVDTKVGALGIGADQSRSIIPHALNLRVGASFFSYSANLGEERIRYNAKRTLGAVPTAADVFPFKNWFRLEGGVIINLNEVTETGQTSSGFSNNGDDTYTSQDIRQINAKVKFNGAAPYFGLGFNNPNKRKGHFGAFFDLEMIDHGTPLATLTRTRTVPQLQADIDKEIRKANDGLEGFQSPPVVQPGLSLKLGLQEFHGTEWTSLRTPIRDYEHGC